MRRSEFDDCLGVLVCLGLRWGMLLPILVLNSMNVREDLAFVFLHAFYETVTSPVGQCFLPGASAVYARHWCVVFECDGPRLMFVLCVLVCVWLLWSVVLPILMLSFLHL